LKRKDLKMSNNEQNINQETEQEAVNLVETELDEVSGGQAILADLANGPVRGHRHFVRRRDDHEAVLADLVQTTSPGVGRHL
jgi:hypothetical protein